MLLGVFCILIVLEYNTYTCELILWLTDAHQWSTHHQSPPLPLRPNKTHQARVVILHACILCHTNHSSQYWSEAFFSFT